MESSPSKRCSLSLSISEKQIETTSFEDNEHNVFARLFGSTLTCRSLFYLSESYSVVPATSIQPCPKVLDGPAGASWAMQYYTAYGGLIGRGNLRKGEYVLITSATGVWGVASIHTAKMVGAIVIVTTVSSGKVEWLKSVGADHVIVTDTEDWSATVKEITYAHGGVDVIFDTVAGEGMNTLGDIAAPGGRIVVYGALSRAPTPFPLYPALAKGLTLHGYTLFEYSGQPQSELY
jgi:NADPH:quinone reductase